MSEEQNVDHTSQFSLDFARENGLWVVLPKAAELQIDIDSNAAFTTFEDNYEMARELGLGVKGYSVRPSKSGGERRHATVTMYAPLESPLQRIALQALLGSDLKRELFSYARLQEGEAIPTLFFESSELGTADVYHEGTKSFYHAALIKKLTPEEAAGPDFSQEG